MPLVSTIKYELGNAPKDFAQITPSHVLQTLKEVRSEIGSQNSDFREREKSLRNVLAVVERGECVFEQGGIQIKIDLSEAKKLIDFYRKYSEGGCQSCIDAGRDVMDARDATSFVFCKTHEKNPGDTQARCGYNSGFSPMVSQHYKNPCDFWLPRFNQTLEKLLEPF